MLINNQVTCILMSLINSVIGIEGSLMWKEARVTEKSHVPEYAITIPSHMQPLLTTNT